MNVKSRKRDPECVMWIPRRRSGRISGGYSIEVARSRDWTERELVRD